MLPREKYIQKGIDNLSDTDLIAVLIGSGIKGKSFMTLSRSVLFSIRNTLKEGREIVIEDISKVDGIGDIKAMQILCGIELGRRLYDLGSKERIYIKNSNDAYILLKDIGSKKQEHIVGIFLNSRFEVLDKRVICIGSLDNVSVFPRDVIIPALELNASSVVLAHNHPSDDPTPSNEDMQITKKIKDGLDLVGINLLDHIVISKNDWARVEI